MSLEKAYKQLIGSPFRYLFWPLSWVYEKILNTRRLFYHPPKHALKVISIGNLDFGGTGKTPFVLYLLKLLQKHKTAVLTRGYKSQFEKRGSTWATPLKDHSNLSSLIGDEPALFLKHFPKTQLYVGKDRELALASAEAQDVEVVILDDGAQFLKIYKDFEILLMDPKDPIKSLVPCGYRRDSLAPLKKASLVVFTYVESCHEYLHAKKQIESYTQTPCCGFKGILDTSGIKQKVALLCGIAQPQRLKNQLEEQGIEVVYFLFLDDHATCSRERLNAFFENGKQSGAQQFVCTEKDFIKLSLEDQKKFNCLKLDFEPSFDRETWERFVGKIGLNPLS